MPVSKVYYVNLRSAGSSDSLLRKLGRLFRQAGLANCINQDDLVAVKLHFGEMGNTAFLRPIYARTIVAEVKQAGGRPFLTDTNTLYLGERSNAVDHLNAAIANGFAYAVCDAPIIIADGLHGKDYVEAEINLNHFQKVKIASAIYHANSLIALSHVKGHPLTGFGGAIKNIAMGGASRGGKQMMHSAVRPEVGEGCIGCSLCVRWCPAGAITVIDGVAQINNDQCIGCGECPVNCPHGVMRIQWGGPKRAVQERMAEFAYGLLRSKEGKAGFINFILDVVPECDCFSWSDAPIVPDLGILASFDPVAIDQASIDLINAAPGLPNSKATDLPRGADKFRLIHPDVDPGVQLEYAEKIGLGQRKYQLVEVN